MRVSVDTPYTSVIDHAEKALLTDTFELLGPDRVRSGLTAAGHTWDTCFLALAAAGEFQSFNPALYRHCCFRRLARISPSLRRAVARAWDRDPEAFRELAAEWLEYQEMRTGHA